MHMWNVVSEKNVMNFMTIMNKELSILAHCQWLMRIWELDKNVDGSPSIYIHPEMAKCFSILDTLMICWMLWCHSTPRLCFFTITGCLFIFAKWKLSDMIHLSDIHHDCFLEHFHGINQHSMSQQINEIGGQRNTSSIYIHASKIPK